MTVGFLQDHAFKCLRNGDLDAYHLAIADRKQVDLRGADLRGTDLSQADLAKVILTDACLKDADLRGCDLRHLNLEGCSIHRARISGVYFPANLSPEEIRLSLEQGTRLRTRA